MIKDTIKEIISEVASFTYFLIAVSLGIAIGILNPDLLQNGGDEDYTELAIFILGVHIFCGLLGLIFQTIVDRLSAWVAHRRKPEEIREVDNV